MSSSEPDLSAFPVIRIDQVPLVDSNILQNAISEATELVKSMNSDEGPKPPLLFYLQRQLKAMLDELAGRDAKDRIHRFLAEKGLPLTSGAVSNNEDLQNNLSNQLAATEYINTSRQHESQTLKSADSSWLAPVMRTFSAPNTLSTVAAAIAPVGSILEVDRKSSVPNKAFKRIPLPSELAWQEGNKAEQKSEKNNANFSSRSRPHELKLSSPRGDEGIVKGDSSNEGVLISSRSECSEYTADDNDDVSVSLRSEGQLSTNSNSNKRGAKMKAPRRNTSASIANNNISNNNPERGSPSKKAATALYKDFGSQFLVAATEKKLRFYPKKVLIESSEEVRKRDRLDRRKAAMRRLIDRREQQQARTTAIQIKKRQQKLEIEKQIAKKKADTIDNDASEIGDKVSELVVSSDGSDSESVSGGDDDGADGDLVDPLVLQRVSDAFERAVKEDKKINQNETNAVKNSVIETDEGEEGTLQGENNVQTEISRDEVKVIQSKVIESKLKNGVSLTSTKRSRDKGRGGTDSTSNPTDGGPIQRNGNSKAMSATKNVKTSRSMVSSNPSAKDIANPDSNAVTLNSSNLDDGYEGAAEKSIDPDSEMQMRASNAIDAVADNDFHPTEILTNANTERVEIENKVENKVTPLESEEVESVENVDRMGGLSRHLSSQISTVKDYDKLHSSDPQQRQDAMDHAGDEICPVIGDEVAEEIGVSEVEMVNLKERVVNENNSIASDMIQKVELNKEVSTPSTVKGLLQGRGEEEQTINGTLLYIAENDSENTSDTSTSFSIAQIKQQQSMVKEQNFDHGSLVNDEVLSCDENDAEILPGQGVTSISHNNKAIDNCTVLADVPKINSDQVNLVPQSDVDVVVGESSEEDDENEGSDEESSEEEDEEPITPLDKLHKVDHLTSKSFLGLPPFVSSSSIHASSNNNYDEDQNNILKNGDENGNSKENEAETGILLNISTTPTMIATPDMPTNMNSENTNKACKISHTAKPLIVHENRKGLVNDRIGINITDNDPSERKTASRPGTNDANTNKPLKIKLADFYPHIGMIFPIAYGSAGNIQAEGFSARALIESMQFQGKLYQEWMEVMGDYATVFSQDRGLPTDDGIGTAAATSSSSVYSGGIRALHYRVKASIRPEVYNIVTDVFNESLPMWNELPSGLGLGLSWNLLWTWSKPRLNMTHLLIWQRVNHFEGSKELTRKDLLKKNIQRYTDMSGKGSEAFEIMPQTFQLPHEYTLFVNAFMACQARTFDEKGLQNFWIMKPVGLSRGRGITLVKDIATLTYSQTSVIQRYIEDPLCLDGYKFDLRLFVLVTSFKPLEAFIYTEGFARVSTDKYSLDPADMENKFIHLTNSSIQKLNAKGISDDNPLMNCAEDSGGSKISLKGPHGLWKRLEGRGYNIQTLWKNISLVVLKSLVMIDEKMSHQPCCFEVFGYDVLIDSQLRCWLIEVNASPSMARENKLDIRVKNAMIRDTISLVNPAPFDRAAVARVLKRRFSDISKNKFVLNKNDPDLEKDLKDILGDFVPRKYGEEPVTMGEYERLCPNTKLHDAVLKMKARIIKSF